MKPDEMSNHKSLTGITAGLGAALFFALMGTAVHLSPPGVPSSQLVFFRALMGVIILGLLLRSQATRVCGRGTMPIWARSVFGVGGVFCYFWTLRHASVADATLLADMSPIFVLVLSSIAMRRFPKQIEVAALGLVLLGVAVINGHPKVAISGAVWMVGLLGALFAALAYQSLSRATQTFSKIEIVFAFSVVMGLGSLAMADSGWSLPSGKGIFLLGAVALMGLLGQIVMTVSYKYLRPEIASALALTSCLFGSLLESAMACTWPSLWSWSAYLMILAGLFLMRQAQDP